MLPAELTAVDGCGRYLAITMDKHLLNDLRVNHKIDSRYSSPDMGASLEIHQYLTGNGGGRRIGCGLPEKRVWQTTRCARVSNGHRSPEVGGTLLG